MTTKHEMQAISNDGLDAFSRPEFSLLKVALPGRAERGSIMATRKDSMNIRAGDIPETDAEVEKLLAKKSRQPKIVRKNLSGAVVASGDGKSIVDRYNENHPLPPEINPALLEVGAPEVLDSAEQAASGSGWQGEEVLSDEEVKKALAGGTPKPKTKQPAKAPKQPRAKKEKPAKAPRSAINPKGFAYITPQIVLGVFADATAGMKRADIATKHNISTGSVSTILSGPDWFVERFTPRLATIGTVYPARPFKAQKAQGK